MLCATWMDRPLSIAGRVLVKEGNTFVSKLLSFDKDLVLIPNVAIHMNRDVNNGMKYNNQVDLLPLFSAGECAENDYYELIADALGTTREKHSVVTCICIIVWHHLSGAQKKNSFHPLNWMTYNVPSHP